jgi:hypothetical protein
MNLQIYSNTPNKEGGKNYNNQFTMTLPEQIDAENEKKNNSCFKCNISISNREC